MTAVPPLFLIGLGQDSHRLREAKKDETLHLAGLTFACGLVAEANSDGDVVLHALFNALSTALLGLKNEGLLDLLITKYGYRFSIGQGFRDKDCSDKKNRQCIA